MFSFNSTNVVFATYYISKIFSKKNHVELNLKTECYDKQRISLLLELT